MTKPDFEGFARAIVNSRPEYDLDGFDIQEIAVRHNLLKIEWMTIPCCSECPCQEYGAEEGELVECYRLNYETNNEDQ